MNDGFGEPEQWSIINYNSIQAVEGLLNFPYGKQTVKTVGQICPLFDPVKMIMAIARQNEKLR